MNRQMSIHDSQLWLGGKPIQTITAYDAYRALIAYAVRPAVAAAVAGGLVTLKLKAGAA